MAEAHQKNHDYHIIDPSPWPFLASVGAFILALGGIGFMQYNKGGEFVLFKANLSDTLAFRHWLGHCALHNVWLVVGYDQGRQTGTPYPRCVVAFALWHDHVHRFRSDVFCRLVLGIL